jgi:hypothetical protein
VTNIIVTVGIGEGNTVITGIIADGNVVCNVIMSKQQVQDHIAVLTRHLNLLPDVNTRLIEHSTLN